MNFSEALDKLKEGCAISHEGWNGKGMYIFGVKGDAVKMAIHDRYGDPENEDSALNVRDAIYMKTTNDELVPWVASQTDILAEDWIVL